tara:strand:+ start:7648 stop:8214 length:567 start_codon:yes stop_codon:yes gene_type:complete
MESAQPPMNKVKSIALIFAYLGIFLIVAMLILFLVLQREVQQNWDGHKCNPMIMNMAPLFGKDGKKTLDECVSQNLDSAADKYTSPFFSALGTIDSSITNVAGSLRDNIEQGFSLTNTITGGLDSITSSILNISNSVVFLVFKIKAIIGKFVAMFWVCLLGCYSVIQATFGIIDGIKDPVDFLTGLNI